jgi:hypothetical protein
MLRLVAARLANRRITDLFCARTRNASFLPANHPHRQPCPARVRTRKPPRCRVQHASVPQRTPHAVPSTRPYPQTASMPCPARARTPMPCPARARTPMPSTRTARRAQHAPAPHTTLFSAARRAQHAPASAHHALLRCPARQYARGSFPRPWTSSLPATTPPQLKCSPHSSTAPSLPTPGLHPPGG